MALTEQERKLAKIIKDPVLWAEHTLKDPNTLNKPLKLRWPQIKVLRDPSTKVVMRFGRRIGKTIALSVKMLHYAFTHANSVQILATPYESQIKVVFDQLSGFIYSSPQLKDSIKGSTKNPWEIVFKNGARIKGFTAGTRSGAEGGSLRGQKADIIYLDVKI